jgi:predicted membrane-bound spermidine synthase
MSENAVAPMHGQAPSSGKAPATYLAVLSLLAAAFMLFQLAVLRELRFQLTTSFSLTPFLFSSIIFFIAIGSLFATRIQATSQRVLRIGVLLLPAILLPVFALMLLSAHGQIDPSERLVTIVLEKPAPGTEVNSGDHIFRTTIFAFIAVGVAGYGIIFFLQGLLFALYFREARTMGVLSVVYAADLIASGAGAVLGGGLAFALTPIQTVLVSEGVFLAALWVSRRMLGIRPLHAGLMTVAAAGLMAVELGGGFITWLENPGFFTELTYSQWSRYRRIDAEEQSLNLMVYADGMLFQVHERNDTGHKHDPRAWMAQAIEKSTRPVKDVLIIGAGSGADVRVLRDLVGDRLNITAVELDQGFIDTARQSPWLWKTYGSAEIIAQEGRYFLENTPRQFDFIIYAFIDPQSATGNIGLPDCNFLYTDAGFRSALARVREGGLLYISRVFVEAEEKEWMGRMCAALESAGAVRENVRLYRDRGSSPWGAAGRLSAMHLLVGKGTRPPEMVTRSRIPVAWVDGGRAPTDMFPFNFGTGIWLETLIRWVAQEKVILIPACALLLGVLVLSGTSKARGTLFALGFGSFMLESLVLFNSFLLFGDPNLSAALAVGVFLLWSGVGSLWSHRLDHSKWSRVAVPAGIVIYSATAPLINAGMMASPVALRLLVFVIHGAIAGIPAGMAFPAALRKFPESSVPVLFFVDVMGCAIAPPLFWLAMNLWGLWMVIVLVTLSYAGVSLVILWPRARSATGA